MKLKKQKRLLAFLLIWAVAFSMVPVQAEDLSEKNCSQEDFKQELWDFPQFYDYQNPDNSQWNDLLGLPVSSEAATHSSEITTTTESTVLEPATENFQSEATTQSDALQPGKVGRLMSYVSEGHSKLYWYGDDVSTIDGYYVYRKVPKYETEYKLIADISCDKSKYDYEYTDKSAVCGLSYYYKVKPYARTATGEIVKGSMSNSVCNKLSFTTPRIKSIKRSGKTITLKWWKLPGVSGYKIYRKSTKGFRLVKTIKKGTTTSYSIKNTSIKTDYIFKIRAYTAFDKHYQYSGYSEIVTAYSKNHQAVVSKINKLKKKYPSYKYWNHIGVKSFSSSTVTTHPCNHAVHGMQYCNSYNCPNGIIGLQCYGFAWKMSDLIYGRDAKIKSFKSFSKAGIGDVIRYNGHSVIIIEKHSTYIKVGECNVGNTCMILWGRKVTKKELKNATYFKRY